jgi:hypothetical protein
MTLGRRWRWAGLGIVILAIGFSLVWREVERPKVSFVLPDGTTVKFVAVKQGHVLRFYEGPFWEKALFAIFRTKRIFKLRVGGQTFVSRNVEGSLMIHMEQTVKNVKVSSYGNNSIKRLELIASSGKEWNGIADGKHIYFSAMSTNRALEIASVDYYYEFPIVVDKELHFRVWSTTSTGVDVTNEFTLPNPRYW